MAYVWIVTDGKAGDENQCLGVAERLPFSLTVRRIAPHRLFATFMPLGPIDPREKPDRQGSPIAPPFPDLAIGSGRRAIAYLRAIKTASGGRCFTVYLKDPRIIRLAGSGSQAADFIWAPEHDHLAGQNVMSTPTSPHRVSQQRLAEARAAPDARLASLAAPRIALLLGGDSKNHHFDDADVSHLCSLVAGLGKDEGLGLMVSPSRRTPPALADSIRGIALQRAGFYWDGEGDNPYIAMLALADHVIVTADSVNMIGEALATGRTVHIFEPKVKRSGGRRKSNEFLGRLIERGLVRRLACGLKTTRYDPVDATPAIAAEIERRFALHRRMLGVDNKT